MNIEMADLRRQYHRLKPEIDAALQEVLESTAFINGPQVKSFAVHLAEYLNVPHVIPCGNGTDAIQMALMALNLQPGDEVIVPAFTYISAVEAVAMLGLVPVLVDVDPETFNLNIEQIEQAISWQTKAVIAVHLFGQLCDMQPLMTLAKRYHLYVVEDNAQSLGAECLYPDGKTQKGGTIGHIGTTSFFPSKPLACYGDGGAMITPDDTLAETLRQIANHGQISKYNHKIIGCNSRLDTLQAAVLEIKLKHLKAFNEARIRLARRYDEGLKGFDAFVLPVKSPFSTHLYHQYTVQVKDGQREKLQAWLKGKGIPTMVYYPLPVQAQEAYKWVARSASDLSVATRLSKEVLSLPIHSELTEEEQNYIIDSIIEFWKK